MYCLELWSAQPWVLEMKMRRAAREADPAYEEGALLRLEREVVHGAFHAGLFWARSFGSFTVMSTQDGAERSGFRARFQP